MAEELRLNTISVHLGPLLFALAEGHPQVAENPLTVLEGLSFSVLNHHTEPDFMMLVSVSKGNYSLNPSLFLLMI